jgi:hypothetical protein
MPAVDFPRTKSLCNFPNDALRPSSTLLEPSTRERRKEKLRSVSTLKKKTKLPSSIIVIKTFGKAAMEQYKDAIENTNFTMFLHSIDGLLQMDSINIQQEVGHRSNAQHGSI